MTAASKVDLVSSIKAHSSPHHAPSTRLGVLVSESSPKASASRRAGSMVTTQVLPALAGALDRHGGRSGGLADSS